MNKAAERIKGWIVDNPDKLMYAITGVSAIGTLLIFRKLNAIEKGNIYIPNDNMRYKIEYVEGGHKLAVMVHDALIEEFGEETGQEIANKLADRIEKM